MKLSIVIPARNEEGNIGKTLHLLSTHLDGADVTNFEILVVDAPPAEYASGWR
jgi:glycosyltransferase involved in cell wall biosynthesis